MKKINLIFTFLIAGFFAFGQNALIGTWKLAEITGALSVGPNQGDASWWFTNNTNDITTRACIFDDSIVFNSNGIYNHYMDGSTWLEPWQGVSSEQCGTPVAPHDGTGTYTWSMSGNTLTIAGAGGHLGLPKAVNGAELSSPGTAVPTSISYIITMINGGNGFYADIQSAGGGTGWWRFIYTKTNLPPPPPPPSYTVTFNVHTDLIAGNVSADGIYIGGGFVGGFDALLLDDSDGDGIWSGSTSLDAAGGHFTILNGNCSDYSCKEDISGQPCADALSYNDRNTLLGGFSQDTTLNLQFGSCTAPQIPSCTVYHADTINTFVSDTLFQNISPQIYLISSQTFPQASNSNCDSIVETWRQFNYSPNYFSDTLTIYDTLTTYDTLITQVFDTLTIYDTTYISISVTDTLYIDITITGVPNIDNTISVYPNPASDVVIIDNGNYNNMSNYNLMIFNSLSQQVFSSQINTQQFQIPVSTLGAEGTYFIQIFDGNNNLVATKYLVLN